MGSKSRTGAALFISSGEIRVQLIHLPEVPAADSAATVQVEAQGTVELV
jgi:hypothetical protein